MYNFASADILAFSLIEFVDKSVMTCFLYTIFLQEKKKLENKIQFMNEIGEKAHLQFTHIFNWFLISSKNYLDWSSLHL